ncbi:MAG TPA: hypothetical protein VHR86_08815 [Armatimonadota bacterium]|nr:hypothetical protein [Armatimonadota bacterium]
MIRLDIDYRLEHEPSPELDPVVRLWAAVIAQAVKDLRHSGYRPSAAAWLRGDFCRFLCRKLDIPAVSFLARTGANPTRVSDLTCS